MATGLPASTYTSSVQAADTCTSSAGLAPCTSTCKAPAGGDSDLQWHKGSWRGYGGAMKGLWKAHGGI
eukprot:531741-Pyramimonas_sp.AAC.2